MKGKNPQVLALNEKLVELAKEFNVPFVNVFSVFADDKNELKSEVTLDGIHLRQAAYLQWANYLKSNNYL
ncbi:GDSL-like Lipase/Acylhydrolase [compost metagenome]